MVEVEKLCLRRKWGQKGDQERGRLAGAFGRVALVWVALAVEAETGYGSGGYSRRDPWKWSEGAGKEAATIRV